MFTSTTHFRFHLLFTHDGRCSYCFRFCEGECSRIYGGAIETAGKEAMKAMKLDKYSTIEELETTLEKMMGKIIVDNVETVQKYANCADAGYAGHDTDAWNMLIYYPSSRTPKGPMSDYLYWWILMDSYEASLDKITTDLQEVKIQSCKCGYLGTNFYGHIWRHHREFINPENGSTLENAMVNY